MTRARIIGWAHSRFGKSEAPDTQSLMAEVLAPALAHAGLGADQVDGLFVGVFNNGFSRQDFQGALPGMALDALRHVPATRYENACATGSAALFGALDFIEAPDLVRPGDRVVSSGDGGVFPAGLLVGTVVQGTDRRLRVSLAADYRRLEFLRVLRSHDAPVVDGAGGLILSPAASPAMTEPAPAPNSVSEEKAAIAAPDALDLLRAEAQDG